MKRLDAMHSECKICALSAKLAAEELACQVLVTLVVVCFQFERSGLHRKSQFRLSKFWKFLSL